jgi:hypothetical protein
MRLLDRNGLDRRLVWLLGGGLGAGFWLALVGLWWLRH